MGDRSVCAPSFAESGAQKNITTAPDAAFVTDAVKVINIQIGSTQVEGDKTEEELLTGLLTDGYCHVCEAVLQFESQRLAHYEGKKHAQKLKVYLQAKKTEKMNSQSAGSQQTIMGDKDRFCELCNMVFNAPVVAKSHYVGKVHAKNLRKQGLQSVVLNKCTEKLSESLNQASANADQESSLEDVTKHFIDPASTQSADIDLKDPNKWCPLCAAPFFNPQMALQHYSGRKHQRNQSKQELLKELGESVQQGSSLMCQMCSVEFNSVEMYHAHMQGNKHRNREKKVADVCTSQEKVSSTFADELADYIKGQKARGITPKTTYTVPLGDRQEEGEEEETFNEGSVCQLDQHLHNHLPTSNNPHYSHPSGYYVAEGWHPPYQDPVCNYSVRRMYCGWDSSGPPPDLTGSEITQTTMRSFKRKRNRECSSSSYSTSLSDSSYSSSSGSSTSDCEESTRKHRHRKRPRRSRMRRGRRPREEDSDAEKRQRRKARGENYKGRRRDKLGEKNKRAKHKRHGDGRQDKKTLQSEYVEEGGEKVLDILMPEEMMEMKKGTRCNIEDEQQEEQDELTRSRFWKEKRKTKDKVDSRTEEEKLWDESILGC
ncbi:zinc finger matrin-type protein 1 isoform X2 [Thalassophryne amazonica]|uniref:zinc finger matrin-type protein 1 isoform X2 n=1 Tax=Thalassophryne amazonica TaxID=390379 RepID=UPI00147172CB|nr:zinc finger matrin-type protein 1 isoform X2 [Thalassophryne amazonica]